MWMRRTRTGSWHVVEGLPGEMARALCGMVMPTDLAPGVAFIDDQGDHGGKVQGAPVCKKCLQHLRATVQALDAAQAAQAKRGRRAA